MGFGVLLCDVSAGAYNLLCSLCVFVACKTYGGMKPPDSALPFGVARKSVFSVPVSSSQLHESIRATVIVPDGM